MPPSNPEGSIGENLVQFEQPKYYYGIWAKHITQYLDATGVSMPKTVVEIGPGGSLGAGLCALLTGGRHYYAFDLMKHTSLAQNAEALESLIELLAERSGVSNARGFPNYQHVLDKNSFPDRFFTEDLLTEALSPESLDSIRDALYGLPSAHTIEYVAPWEDEEIYGKLRDQVDFVFSHSVMEHVGDIERAYQIMGEICKPGAGISHQIDFRSHGFSRPWNAYRTIADEEWEKLCDNKPYTINREAPSRHLELMEQFGFRIVRLIPRGFPNSISRERLAPRFQRLPESDLMCAGLMVQAVRL